ncbi:uncharacterized protein V6R79_017210 [Siganus canaliculatus]
MVTLNHLQKQCDGALDSKFLYKKKTRKTLLLNEFLLWLTGKNNEKKLYVLICWRNSGLSAILVPVLLSLFCERRCKKEGRRERERERERGEETDRQTDVYTPVLSVIVSCFRRQLRRRK